MELPAARSLVPLLTVWAVAGCASVSPTVRVDVPTSVDRPFVAGYHVYWAEDAWEEYPFDLFDEVFVFEIELGGDGRVADAHGWPTRWQGLVRRGLDAGVQVVPTVSMHDPDAFQGLFEDPARSRVAVRTVLDLLHEVPGLAGVHLDLEVFEPVSADARDGFSAFVVDLAQEMRREFPGRSLSVFTLAFDDDDVYDERVLGAAADYLVVQGYDYHSRGSETAGPVGPLRGWGRLNWEEVVARFVSMGIAPRKLVMSVPLYGYEWPVTSEAPGATVRGVGAEVPYDAPRYLLPDRPRARDQARRLGVRRDFESGSPWYVYRDDSGWVQGWFEDAESVLAKYAFVTENGLGGIAIFPIAYGDADLWAVLRRNLAR